MTEDGTNTSARSGILLGCLVLCVLALVGGVQAAWVYQGGVTGQVENTGLLVNPNLYHYGWGLDFQQKGAYPGTSNWVHFTVPTQEGVPVRQITLKYWTNGLLAYIGQIDVWNGDVKVATLRPPSTDPYGWSVGYNLPPKTLTLDLPTPQVFSGGITICVNTRTGSDPDWSVWQFKFHSVGINEGPGPTPSPVVNPADAKLKAIEDAIFRLTNEERTKRGLQALQNDAGLASLARAHSKDMADHAFFDHVNPQGLDPFERAAAAGIPNLHAENIAKMPTGNVIGVGYVNDDPESIARAIVQQWMASTMGHREILLGQYARTGVGVAFDGKYYLATQDYV